MNNFHCPYCARKPNVRAKCCLEAEIKAKQEAELRAKEKLEKDREERGQADELAGAMHEFFAQFYEECMTSNDSRPAEDPLASSMSELPIPSPDSITVTTEFGVVEEPANITTITAAGPSPYHHAYDVSEDEGATVEMTEDLEEAPQIHSHPQPLTVDAVQQLNSVTVEMGSDDAQDEDDVNDTGEEADIDTDDFDIDPESAIFIDGFGGTLHMHADGTLTPTTTLGD